MLIRFIVQNLFSFGDRVEFDMLKYPKIRKHMHHCSNDGCPSVLRFGAIYGANGAGKSNIIKAMRLLLGLVYLPEPIKLSKYRNKFAPSDLPQILGIEFRADGKNYYYEIESVEDIIVREILTYQKAYKTKLGSEVELFSRKQESGRTSIRLKEPQSLERSIASLLRPSESLLAFAYDRLFDDAPDIKRVTEWLRGGLVILDSNTFNDNMLLPLLLNTSTELREDLSEAIGSLDTGVEGIKIASVELSEESEAYKHLSSNANVRWGTLNGREYAIYGGDTFIKENGQIYKLREDIFHHNKNIPFRKEEESDGTIKLMQMMPFFLLIRNTYTTLIVDEVERSIHPLLIKKLLEIWTNGDIKGQLIFTTHESLLLDFDILRKDEIWFAEKDVNGITDLYPLNDFVTTPKQDRAIAKAYLNGRFGAVPYLAQLVGNLKKSAKKNES